MLGPAVPRPSTGQSRESREEDDHVAMEYLNSPVEMKRLSAANNRKASNRISALDRVLIQVTEDNERFSVVDISGLWSAEAIKEKMLRKLCESEAIDECMLADKLTVVLSQTTPTTRCRRCSCARRRSAALPSWSSRWTTTRCW